MKINYNFSEQQWKPVTTVTKGPIVLGRITGLGRIGPNLSNVLTEAKRYITNALLNCSLKELRHGTYVLLA